ncbi:MAG: PKD domain-containing protein [Methanoculleus bourgensis]|jgi:PKD repeat protein|uniref:PKD domain-containing protein n=1 Tax=Methanoculleus bourgensis TaxID=83986 RepID=A0A8T7H7S5_9EURY|nr:PKD domain-containing protein [Methanoculleus bourgensis]
MARFPKPEPTGNDHAVSESIGAILLISVIALGISIFAVAVFSQQAAPVLPSVTFNITYGENGSVSIRHLGGDTIPRDQLRIYIENGTAVHDNHALFEAGNGWDWTAWSIGDILVYNPPAPLPEPSEVLIAYADPGGGKYVLYISEGWRGEIPMPTTVPTTEPTPVPLAADFTANVTYGPAPLAVAFTDTSTGEPTSWSWDFGDGSTSIEQNPVHIYIIPGTYTVTLTAKNAHGNDTRTKPEYITVASPVIADFTANITSGEAPLAVQFTDLSRGDGITSWSWDFGDGGTSNEQNPVHTYTAEGTYNVTLTARNAYGSDKVTKSGYISVTAMHVSRLEVNAVTWYLGIPVSIAIDYTGNPEPGSATTPFVLSRTNVTDSGFNVTLTAPGEVTLLEFFDWKIVQNFKMWRVSDRWYENRTIEVSVPDAGRETARAYYTIQVLS